MKTILIARHGQSEANAEKMIQGASYDTDLTALGRKQAIQMGQTISDYLTKNKQTLEIIYASELKRSQQTASKIQKVIQKKIGYKVAIIKDKRLNERSLGVLEGLSLQQAQKMYPQELTQMFANPDEWPYVTPGGGETQKELAARIQSFLKDIDQKTILIVGHFGPIQHIIGEIQHKDYKERFNIRPAHDKLIIVEKEGNLL